MKVEAHMGIIFILLVLTSAIPLDEPLDESEEDDLSAERQIKCAFECEKGTPVQNPDYQPTHNGCGSYGFNIDFKKCPYLTQCCNAHDLCYDKCGADWTQCDRTFKTCTQNAPTQFNHDNRGLCKAYGSVMYYLVRIAGCPAFKNSQKKACICI